jgi:hypothetical protein
MIWIVTIIPFYEVLEPKFVKKDRGYLTEGELYIIKNKIVHNASLRTVRDLFIFACYIGLAFSDAYELTNSNIRKGIDGEDWIIIERKKTMYKRKSQFYQNLERLLSNTNTSR